MRIDITTSGDFKATTKWLTESKNKVPTKTMNALGKQGVQALKNATPKGETGETAAGWTYKVEKTSRGAELSFLNNAHPELNVNIARLIQFGHGTGTGGYVQPIDYINPALNGIFKSMGDRIAEEVFN